MNGKPGRTAEQQHTMLLHAMDVAGDAAAAHDNEATIACIRNQEVQALTLIALELRELRRLRQSQHRRTGERR